MSFDSKGKGKKYEDKIALILHKYFYTNFQPYKELFDSVGNPEVRPKRDSSSGTFKNSDGDIDLGLLKKFFPFSIECKHRKELNFPLNTFLSDSNKILSEIWKKQVIPKSEQNNLLPIIVFSANRTKIFCYFDKNIFTNLPNRCIIIDDKIICLFEDMMKLWLKEELY